MYCMGSREGSAVGEYEFYHFFDIHVRARGSQDAELSAREQEETRKLLRWRRTGTQCTCFTRTNAQILTPAELRVRAAALAADEPVHGEGDAGAPAPDELAHTLDYWARAALPAHLGGQGRGAADAGARGLLGAPRHDP